MHTARSRNRFPKSLRRRECTLKVTTTDFSFPYVWGASCVAASVGALSTPLVCLCGLAAAVLGQHAVAVCSTRI